MSVSTGLAVVFAATSVFLALALTGALIQRRSLMARVAALSGASELPPFLRGRLVLLISKGCPACAEALSVLRADYADARVLVLASSDDGLGPDVTVDPDAWMKLFPGYTPCLIELNEAGHVMSTEPVGSPAALRAQLRRLAMS